jgi:hypothetical protein
VHGSSRKTALPRVSAAITLHRLARTEKYAATIGAAGGTKELKIMFDRGGVDADETKTIKEAAGRAIGFITGQWYKYHRSQSGNGPDSHPPELHGQLVPGAAVAAIATTGHSMSSLGVPE